MRKTTTASTLRMRDDTMAASSYSDVPKLGASSEWIVSNTGHSRSHFIDIAVKQVKKGMKHQVWLLRLFTCTIPWIQLVTSLCDVLVYYDHHLELRSVLVLVSPFAALYNDVPPTHSSWSVLHLSFCWRHRSCVFPLPNTTKLFHWYVHMCMSVQVYTSTHKLQLMLYTYVETITKCKCTE